MLTLLLFLYALLSHNVLAASVVVSTIPILSTFTSTYYSTTSSIVGTTVSVETTGVSCQTTANDDGSPVTVCISAARATALPIYDSEVLTLTSTVISTVRYSTMYSDVPVPVSFRQTSHGGERLILWCVGYAWVNQSHS